MKHSHHFPKHKEKQKADVTEMFLLEKVQILPVGMSRHNATTYAVIRIFMNIPVKKKLCEKLGTGLLKFQSYTKKACKRKSTASQNLSKLMPAIAQNYGKII